jgi:hypothetical protein
MSKKPEYKAISIKEEFAQSIEDFIGEHPTFGYRSIAQFLEDSARHRLEELKAQVKELPRFEQVNIDENGTKILDRNLHEVVQIYIKPQGINCGFHQINNCEHTDFALTLKNVRETIRKKRKEGWKLPDV